MEITHDFYQLNSYMSASDLWSTILGSTIST